MLRTAGILMLSLVAALPGMVASILIVMMMMMPVTLWLKRRRKSGMLWYWASLSSFSTGYLGGLAMWWTCRYFSVVCPWWMFLIFAAILFNEGAKRQLRMADKCYDMAHSGDPDQKLEAPCVMAMESGGNAGQLAGVLSWVLPALML